MIRNAVDGGHKILLFSQFTTMLDRLAARLRKEEIPYHMLTGSTEKEKRAQMAEAFAEDEVPVFLISLKAGGTGLNLTAADIVIHFDPCGTWLCRTRPPTAPTESGRSMW